MSTSYETFTASSEAVYTATHVEVEIPTATQVPVEGTHVNPEVAYGTPTSNVGFGVGGDWFPYDSYYNGCQQRGRNELLPAVGVLSALSAILIGALVFLAVRSRKREAALRKQLQDERTAVPARHAHGPDATKECSCFHHNPEAAYVAWEDIADKKQVLEERDMDEKKIVVPPPNYRL